MSVAMARCWSWEDDDSKRRVARQVEEMEEEEEGEGEASASRAVRVWKKYNRKKVGVVGRQPRCGHGEWGGKESRDAVRRHTTPVQ